MLQFCPPNSSEKALMERFAKLNIGAGKSFDWNAMSPELKQAVSDGIADAGHELAALMKQINADQVSTQKCLARENS